MRNRMSARILALALVLATVLSIVPVSTAAQPTSRPNNAEAIVTRGEAAFAKGQHEFQANWIWSADDDGGANRWMAFRKDVTLSEDDLSSPITAKISADTKYWLWINGEMAVFEGQLKRGPALLKTDIYPEGSNGQPNLAEMIQEVATYYDEVDLTPWLQAGENTIVALVWYFGNEGHSHVGSGKGAFLFEAQMGSQLVVSDSTWKVSRHMGYQPSSGVGGYAQEFDINYDARSGYNDFYQPAFDVSGWKSAAVVGRAGDKPWNELWPRTIPEWKVWERITYTTEDTDYVTNLGTDAYGINYRVDLPTNIQFVPYLKVKAPAGKVIRITCPNSGGSTVVYTTTGAENGEAVVQEYESPAWINWWFVNFNIPTDVEILEIGYRQTGYQTELTGSFTSNSEFFNTLWTKARDTVYVNIRDTFMDCPDRERAPWLGDMVNEAQIAYYTMDEAIFDMIRKDVATRINWQNDDGVIPTTVPMTFRSNEYAELPGQSLAGVMSWFDYYLYSGDRTTLEQAYPALLKYMELFDLETQAFSVPFTRRNGTNTVHTSWVDWGSNIDKDLCLNIWAYIGVQTVIKFARELGDSKTLTRYEAIRDTMRNKFDITFWNGSEFRSASYTGPADDRGQALAVVAGLVTPDKYDAVKKILVNNQFASPYMIKYSIEALYLLGDPDAAETRMLESYANDVNSDDPTFSEGWNGSGTKNHGWSGGGLIGLSGYAAGVRPLAAGYSKVLVKPQMGSALTDVDAVIPTIKGNIHVVAGKTASDFSLSVNIPEGSEGLIGIPRTEGSTAVYCGDTLIWCNGTAVNAADGLTYDSNDYSHIYFTAQPGDWSFTAKQASSQQTETCTLTIPATENGTVTVNGTSVSLPYQQSFPAGTQVTVAAIADADFAFAGFDGSFGTQKDALTFQLDADQTVCAHFEPLYRFHGAKLSVDANRAGVSITLNGRALSGSYTDYLEYGTNVTLEAFDSEEYAFVQWQDETGKTLSTEAKLTLTMEKAITCRALYTSRYGDNLALGKTVTVSSSVTGNAMFGAEKAVDGVYTVTGSNEGWTSLETASTQWITVDLGSSHSINRVKLIPRNNGVDNGYGIPEDFEILVSEDGESWQEVYTVTGLERPLVDALSYTFIETNARYLKVNGSKLRENPQDGNRKRFQLAELEIYGTAAAVPKNNLALNKAVEVSTSVEARQFSAVYATDGKYSSKNVNEGWTSDELLNSQWISVDLGELCTINEVALFPRIDGINDGYGIPENLEILVSADGEHWEEAYAATGLSRPTTEPVSCKFPETAARYVKVNGSKLRSNPNDNGFHRFQLSELEIYGTIGVPHTNLALGGSVEASTSVQARQFSTAYATDGKYTVTGSNEGWTSDELLNSQWISVDLGQLSQIDSVLLFPRNNGKDNGYGIPIDLEILVSTDNKTWTQVYSITNQERPLLESISYAFDPAVARYVKINGSKLRSNPNDNGYCRFQLSELEVYGIALDAVAVARYWIDAIGQVSTDSGEAIAAARTAYDAVPDAQKSQVENYDLLEAAELYYATLTREVALVLHGANTVTVDDNTVTYTLGVKNASNLATVLLIFQLPDAGLENPVVDVCGQWYLVAQVREGNLLKVALAHNAGLFDDGDLMSLTLSTTGQVTDATVTLTDAVLSAFLGDTETFVSANRTDASVTTTIAHSIYDVNCDGVVNLLDITRAQRWYGTTNASCDVNGDRQVNIEDMILILNHYTTPFGQ